MQFLQSLHQSVISSIRFNQGKLRIEEELEKVPWCNHACFLSSRPSFVFDPLWHAGAYYVQEASSMFLEQVFKQIETDHPRLVLDLCAAPGGKSTHLNSLMDDDDFLVANETIRSRVPVLIENLTKWGMSNFVVSNSDASVFGKLNGLFDVILIDAPCSGEGLFRREPEAAKEWSVDNTKLCSARQRRLLADCWPALKTGGYLIYSTCTFNPEENEKNLIWIKENSNYESIRIPLNADWNIDELEINGIYAYRFLPHQVKGEGFFISLIKKTENEKVIRIPRSFRQKLNRPVVSIPNWINSKRDLDYFQYQDQLKFIPSRWTKAILFFLENVRLSKLGISIGTVKGKELIPSHELAMNVHLIKEQFPINSLNEEDAINYLRKENILIDSSDKGWNLVSFKNIPLGFIKKLGNRSNNYYPKELRIRASRHKMSNRYLPEEAGSA